MSEQRAQTAGAGSPPADDRTRVLPRLAGLAVDTVNRTLGAPRAAADPPSPSPEPGASPAPPPGGVAAGGSAPLAQGAQPRPAEQAGTGAGAAARPGAARALRSANGAPGTPRGRRARLRLRRVDPWSVFLLALVTSLFLAIVLVVAVVALYAVLAAAGVPDSVNQLFAEVTRRPGRPEPGPLLTAGRAITTAGVVAAVDVVLLTALSTLGALLYNVCASFTGGVEVTLAERD